MMIVDSSAKTNWKFIGIIVTLTILVGGFFVYSLLIQQENPVTQLLDEPVDNEMLNEKDENAISETTSITKLEMTLKDVKGNAVPFAKAELLLVAWGETKRLELPTEGNRLMLSLDEEWLTSQWTRPLSNMIAGYLYIQADGYASVRSEPFLWIGAVDIESGKAQRVSELKINFPDGSGITVPEGENRKSKLVLRKPQARYLRFIDDEGKSVSGVSVTSSMFWSASNHCGFLNGVDLLDESVSDAKGRVLVPDGDIEYVFELQKPHYVLDSHKNDNFPQQLITYLIEDETVVKLHERQKRPLDMIITKNGTPANGEILSGELADYPGGTCGANYGPVATADENGRIQLSDFYPEEWTRVYFGGIYGTVWEADPKLWAESEVIQIDLKSQ